MNFSTTAKSLLTQKGMVMLKIWATMLLNHHWTGDVPWSGWHETMFLEVERLCSGLRGVNCYNLRVVQTPGNSLTPINVGTTLGFKRDRGALLLVMRFPKKLLWTFPLEKMLTFWPKFSCSMLQLYYWWHRWVKLVANNWLRSSDTSKIFNWLESQRGLG